MKYKLTAVWLGYKSVVSVALPFATTLYCRLWKMAEKAAVGVPVQSSLLAEERMVWKAEVTAGERAPCT